MAAQGIQPVSQEFHNLDSILLSKGITQAYSWMPISIIYNRGSLCLHKFLRGENGLSEFSAFI